MLSFFLVNGAQLIDSRIQPVQGANYALLDTGNPIMAIPPDVIAQITNAWAANPDVSIVAVVEAMFWQNTEAD